MENIKWKEIRRGRGRRSPVDRRVSCVGYAGPERRSGKDRRAAQGLTTCVAADGPGMGVTEEAAAEVHGRRLTDRLRVQQAVLPKRRYSLLSVKRAITKITPARTQPKALKTHYSTIYYDNVDQLYGFSEVIEGERRTVKGAEGGGPKKEKKEGKKKRIKKKRKKE